jgi:hypothetical protein
MKRLLIVLTALQLLPNATFAQAAAVPTPSLSATSPLGTVPSAPVGGTGIPFGSTEIASPGVSPLPLPSTATASAPGSTTCQTLGMSPSTMYGSSSTYDGGGMSVGSASTTIASAASATTMSGATPSFSGVPATSPMIDTSGMSAMCGSGASSVTASSTPAPGSASRTGIPLGSTEIQNLGASSAIAVPTIVVSPPTITTGSIVPTMPNTVPSN